MKFFAVASLFIAGVLAVPTGGDNAGTPICPNGLFANPQCCDADVLGAIGIGCNVPINPIRDARSFREECARNGKEALCCVAPVAGQALLCQRPVGAN